MTHPAFNALLNVTSGVLLVAGFIAIKRGQRSGHAKLMVSAALMSGAFLVSYVVYHASVLHTPYERYDWTRGLYFAVLISHVLLAIVNLPMVVRTLWLAKKQDWIRHKKWARWTFPIWLYVSVTGVVVYVMLYEL